LPTIGKWKERVRQLKQEVFTLYLACRDPRTPWYAKLVLAAVVAYALSPIDLIPDPIPILGYLDDIVLLPLGIYLALKMVPTPVLLDCRRRAQASSARLPKNWIAAAIIVLIWLAVAVAISIYVWRLIVY
jgi:uncharacterized membrane protein YkvA (DUF1232 family)